MKTTNDHTQQKTQGRYAAECTRTVDETSPRQRHRHRYVRIPATPASTLDMIANPATCSSGSKAEPTRMLHPTFSQRFHVYRLHEQPPSLVDCCLTHLDYGFCGKSWQALNQGYRWLLLVFVLCIMRLLPWFLVDFSHLLKPYYCSCKPYALPALPLRFPLWLHPTRRFQNGRFYLHIHVVPRSASSAVHVQRPLDVPSNIRCAGRV